LPNLSDEDFNQIVTSLIKAKKAADVTLEEEVNRNWNEIVSGEYLFDRHAKEILLLEGCTKSAVVEYMNGFLKRSEQRRKLSVQVSMLKNFTSSLTFTANRLFFYPVSLSA
jgi:nardilysin